MKRHWLKKTAAVLVISLMTTTLSDTNWLVNGSTAYAATQSSTRESISFTDMNYEHYDTTTFYKTIKQIKKLMKKSSNSTKVLKKFDKLLTALDDILNEYQLAELYNTIDITDEYYISEYTYSYSTYTTMSDAVTEIAQAILSSKCAKAAKKAWGSETVDYYLNSEVNSTKLEKLLNQEQELLLEYNTNSVKTYSVTKNGTTYTMDDLYADNDLSAEDQATIYSMLLAKENRTLGSIYVKLVKVRQKIAKCYGYDDYSEYCYTELYDRDYSISDSIAFCDEVKTSIVPLYQKITETYDYTASDALDSEFSTLSSTELLNLMKPYLSQISSSLVECFNYMVSNNLYSLDYSADKLSGGFTTFLSKYNEPFLYNQPDFCFYDMMSLVHEFGHFNSYYTNYEDGDDYNNLDVAEIHSQGLELLYTNFYKDMLGDEDGTAAINYTIYQRLDSIVEGCLFDEFQREVYQLENPTLAQINSIYTDLCKEYGLLDSDYTGTAYDWIDVSHNFDSPLYYISYAISVAPAFEIWEDSLTDWDSACSEYLSVVNCGEASPYLDTLETCGLTSPFSAGYLEKLATTISDYLNIE